MAQDSGEVVDRLIPRLLPAGATENRVQQASREAPHDVAVDGKGRALPGAVADHEAVGGVEQVVERRLENVVGLVEACLLYTSDAADE